MMNNLIMFANVVDVAWITGSMIHTGNPLSELYIQKLWVSEVSFTMRASSLLRLQFIQAWVNKHMLMWLTWSTAENHVILYITFLFPNAVVSIISMIVCILQVPLEGH